MTTRSVLKISLFTAKSLTSSTTAATVYQILDDSIFPPERFDVFEPIRSVWSDRDKFLASWEAQSKRNFGQVLWRRRTGPSYFGDVEFTFGPASRRHMISVYGVSEANCKPAILDALLTLADELFVTLDMDYGRVCLSDSHYEQNMAREITPKGTLGAANAVGMKWPTMIPGMYWVNYFGPEYFRQGFAPCLPCDQFFEVKRFDNGGVRIKIAEDPRYFRTAEGHEFENRARGIMGKDWFFRKGEDAVPNPLNTDPSVFAKPPSKANTD